MEEVKNVEEKSTTLAYFAGMVDSGSTVGFVKRGKNKTLVPIVRMSRSTDKALRYIKKKWGGSLVPKHKGFELIILYSKTLVFLKAIEPWLLTKKADMQKIVEFYEKNSPEEEQKEDDEQ